MSAFTVVAIGASAGGLEAVSEFLKRISPTSGMAFIYVQHLSPDHKSILTTLLSQVTTMKVQDVEDMAKMKPNNVYIMPYNKGIEVTNGHIKLVPRPSGFTLSIDLLFTSLAETHQENVIGILLSGGGSDGTEGLKEIKQAGGITFAQDDTAKFSSMPRSAIAAKVADFVLSPADIAKKLNWMGKHPLVKKKKSKNTPPEDAIDDSDGDLKKVIQLLHNQTNVDFSVYKSNTIKRRLLRRMLLHKVPSLKEYALLCDTEKEELPLLFRDLLINVTEFFRDPEVFLFLKKVIFPRLFKRKKQGETLRIWVSACSTGEEVYSLAMLLVEIQDSKYDKIPFQIFASDLSAEAIHEARRGEYSKQSVRNVSAKRLQRFFIKSKDKYRISKVLRDVCIFATHNVLRDPPFSRMDFISCRNLLIYLDVNAQKNAISTFHYALNDEGCLMLGKSETIGASRQLFISPINKVYTRKKNNDKARVLEVTLRTLKSQFSNESAVQLAAPKRTSQSNIGNLGTRLDTFLLEEYIPASVIINYDLDVLQFRGDTSPYLQNTSGRASLNILKMAHVEISFELRNAIHHAIKSKQKVLKAGVEMSRNKSGAATLLVNIEVTPFETEEDEELLVIVFTAKELAEKVGKTGNSSKSNSVVKDRRIKKLEEEIAAARHDMASITQDQEAANEELQSANEEIVSSNEELQSLNEELETSKEEIESTNEELITTNQELQTRIHQVEELTNYYETILSTIHEPMLILDKDIRLKSANQSFCKMFQVNEEDILNVSLFNLGNNQWNSPQLRKLLEEIVPKNNHFEDFEIEHTFPKIGLKTMLLNAHRIVQQSNNEELIVLAISDITKIKMLAAELQLKETKILEVQLEAEKKANKKIEESNVILVEAKVDAEEKTKIAEDAVKSKQQFLSNMSHEIRTPMNAIIGFTNVVLNTKLDDKQKEYLTAVKISGEALIILINDILDLAKVDAGKMTFEQIDFNLFNSVSGMLHLFETKIQEKNLRLVKEYGSAIPSVVSGDPLRLRQIILNLVSNAVKFTASGTITVSIKKLKENKKTITIEFCVADTGCGIDKKQLKRIFDDFGQETYETSRLHGGTGLGLSIVKKLVELQGGTISVESALAKGSTFTFVLDFQKSDLTKNAINSDDLSLFEVKNTNKKRLEKPKVLIVEDIALNQLLLKIILADFGFDFDIANNGKIAIEKMKSSSYDIILMDLQMPEMNGFEATDYIRNVLKSSIPIIALTADVTNIDVKKCIAVGMNDYISKPIVEKLLYAKITKYLKEENE